MRCVLNNNSRPLILPNPLQTSLLGLPCLEAEATVAVGHPPPMVDETIIVVVALHPTTKGVAPTSPMMLLLHHGLHVRFVAS
jgi:hypothetical protein